MAIMITMVSSKVMVLLEALLVITRLLVVDRVQNFSGLILMIDFGYGLNGFETFTIFRVWVHKISKNSPGSGQVVGFEGF